MSAYEPLSAKLMQANGSIFFHCPGCKKVHGFRVTTPGDNWSYNGNPAAPTFSPSLLVSSHSWTPPVTPENLGEWRRNPWPQVRIETGCHSFVTDGQIQFLSDCTHALAGQTVPLPDWSES